MPKFTVVTDKSKNVILRLRDKIKARGLRGIIIPLVILLVIVTGIFLFLNRPYSSYEVMSSFSSGTGASVKYSSYKAGVLRCSNDGVTYFNDKLEQQWSQGFDMQSPMLDVCGDYIAVADVQGSDVYVFNSQGLIKKIELTNSVEQICVNAKGYVFTVLGGQDRKMLRYYNSSGELIAEGMAQLTKTGYPLSCDISEDGRLFAVSYLFVSNGMSKTNLVFYNFDESGQTSIDRIVSSYEYDSCIFPEIRFMGNETAVAIGDSQALIFQGHDKPSLSKTIDFSKELKSVFFGDDRFGLTFKKNGEENPYTTEVYKANGNRIGNFSMDIHYDSIVFSGDNVLAYSDQECKLYSMSGGVRFNYTFDKKIMQIQPINSGSRYILAASDQAQIIKLK